MRKLFVNMTPSEKLDYLYKNHIIKKITIIRDDEKNAILKVEFNGLKMKKNEFQLIMDKLDVISVETTDLKDNVAQINSVLVVVQKDISNIDKRLTKLEDEARKHNWSI